MSLGAKDYQNELEKTGQKVIVNPWIFAREGVKNLEGDFTMGKLVRLVNQKRVKARSTIFNTLLRVLEPRGVRLTKQEIASQNQKLLDQ